MDIHLPTTSVKKKQGSSVLTRTQTVGWAMVKTLIDGELLEAK